jgi:hypothetical protein
MKEGKGGHLHRENLCMNYCTSGGRGSHTATYQPIPIPIPIPMGGGGWVERSGSLKKGGVK